MISLRLTQEKFEVLEASEGVAGLKKAQDEQPDLVLLGLMLPFTTGLDILQKLRAHWKSTQLPIIVVSAMEKERDVIVCFELGADDYVTKPFNMSVLLARINALLRRCRTLETPYNQ